MAKSYTLVVEFYESLDGRSPVIQYLDVTSSGPEFDVLLDALNKSSYVEKINVYSNPNGVLHPRYGLGTKLSRQDLGINYDTIFTKIQ